jgi:hypothetical protein
LLGRAIEGVGRPGHARRLPYSRAGDVGAHHACVQGGRRDRFSGPSHTRLALGEESYALRGGLGPTTESVLIAFRTGPFIYMLQCDGGDRDAFEPFAFDLLATVVARAEFTDSPDEAHLRALLPTEAEVGLPVTEEEY